MFGWVAGKPGGQRHADVPRQSESVYLRGLPSYPNPFRTRGYSWDPLPSSRRCARSWAWARRTCTRACSRRWRARPSTPDPRFVEMMDQIKAKVQYAFSDENALTIPVSAPGSAGMETRFANLVEPWRQGHRLRQRRIRRAHERERRTLRRRAGRGRGQLGRAGGPAQTRKMRSGGNPDAKLVASVHAETSDRGRSRTQKPCVPSRTNTTASPAIRN